MNSTKLNIPKLNTNTHTKKFKTVFSDAYLPYILILPTLILIAMFTFFPILNVFRLSLENNSNARFYENGFIGLKNFENIFFNDPLFYKTIWTTIRWVVYEVGLQVLVGLLVALLLNQAFKGRGFIRALMFAPWAVSGVLTTMLWALMYNQHIGLINKILMDLGILKTGVAWLSNIDTVFGAVILAELWRGIPFFSITLLAALQSIPSEIYESCEVDGCGKFKKFFYITLPYLKESIVFSTLLRAIWEFNSIDMIFTMTNGGPIHMTTTLPIYLMQTSIIEGNYGYGSALAVVIFFFLLIFAGIYMGINNFGRGINE